MTSDLGLIDPHIHLLPGVDDGALSMTAALEAARQMVAEGVTAAICTPHLALGQYDNYRDQVLSGVASLQQALYAAGIPLQVFPGCEALAHPRLPELLAQGQIATLADGGQYLLLEIPWTLLPPAVPSLDNLMGEIEDQGVRIILAHPERYELVHKYPEWLEERVARGLLVQLNAAHLLVSEAGTVGKTARSLLERGLVHFIGSDGHCRRHRPVNLGSTLRELAQVYGNGLMAQATANARGIIAGAADIPPIAV